jgi:hypothetical protein
MALANSPFSSVYSIHTVLTVALSHPLCRHICIVSSRYWFIVIQWAYVCLTAQETDEIAMTRKMHAKRTTVSVANFQFSADSLLAPRPGPEAQRPRY